MLWRNAETGMHFHNVIYLICDLNYKKIIIEYNKSTHEFLTGIAILQYYTYCL